MRRIALMIISLLPSSGFAEETDGLVKARFFQSEMEWPAAPAFSEMRDVQEKKQRFFEFLAPKVIHANAEILKARAFLLGQRERLASGSALTSDDTDRIRSLAAYYDHPLPSIKQSLDARWDSLLQRVDTLPVSLVLAQAANESGWGTSRFAVDGNNFFGVWCYVEGCGLKPMDRDHGARHEVKRFSSIYEGVAAYIHNINTNPAYADLRAIRMSMRSLNVPARGVQLAEGLQAYSIRGEDYVRDIQAMIRSNGLDQLITAEKV